jgi:AraC-like DNA-binding protein
VERVNSVDEFVRSPVGRWYGGATHLVWCASPTLCGSTHWGRPSARDVHELTDLYEIALALHGFDVFMDDSAVEMVDWTALGVLNEYLRRRLPEWGGRIRKQAVVVPSGAVAVILAGVVPLLGSTYPMKFFSTRGAAAEWLERGDTTPILDQVERLAGELRGIPPLVRDLRSYLEGVLVAPSIAAAARALGRSVRSLQRELRQSRTSFGAELSRARVRAACTLLYESDEKIEAIARRVGCITSSRLSALFRKELGETPLAYRTRSRA